MSHQTTGLLIAVAIVGPAGIFAAWCLHVRDRYQPRRNWAALNEQTTPIVDPYEVAKNARLGRDVWHNARNHELRTLQPALARNERHSR